MKYIIILTFLALCSCSKNNCDTAIEGTNYLVSNESKSYLSIYENSTTAKYLDSNGDTINLAIVSFIDDVQTYEIAFPCEEDPSQSQVNTGQSQFIEVELYNDLFEDAFVMNLSQTISADPDEVLQISKGNYRLNLENAELLRGVRTPFQNAQSEIIESVELNGNIFFDVVEGRNEADNLFVMFNEEFGLFYIKDELLDIELHLIEVE